MNLKKIEKKPKDFRNIQEKTRKMMKTIFSVENPV